MKLTYFTLIFLTFFIAGCQKNVENPASTPNSTDHNIDENMEQNRLIEFGKSYAKAWSSQKPEKVAAYFAADGWLTVNQGTPAIGTEAITGVAKGFMDAFPDMVVMMDSIVTKENKTYFHWTLVGTNTGPGGTGNKVTISGFEEWTLNEDGLVQESLGSFDEEDYHRQLEGIE